jgi:hypothetical protein
MNPYYSELSFQFDPLTDMDVALKQILPQRKIDLKYINPKLINIIKSLGLRIHYSECFMRKPGNISPIHSDTHGKTEFVKINWIYGGKEGYMSWFRPKEKSSGSFSYTTANTAYILYKPDEVDLVCKVLTENKPYLIQAGIPHGITNPTETRFCICCLLSYADGRPISMSEAQETLKDFINLVPHDRIELP